MKTNEHYNFSFSASTLYQLRDMLKDRLLVLENQLELKEESKKSVKKCVRCDGDGGVWAGVDSREPLFTYKQCSKCNGNGLQGVK